MNVEPEILKALQTATTAAIAACVMKTLPVKYVNMNEPENDGKWLEIIHIPNNVDNEFWGNSRTYRGLYRFILHWPILQEGAYEPLHVLRSIVDHFTKGATFSTGDIRVKIYDEPDLRGVIEDAPELLFPVEIRYTCFQPQ